jgi:hypothetical protein
VSRQTRPPGPLDAMLEDLRRLGLLYRWTVEDIRVWEAVCPACRKWGLRLREPFRNGPVSLDCTGGGCDDGAIRWAFSADPAEWRIAEAEWRIAEALEIAEQSRDIAARALELAAAV